MLYPLSYQLLHYNICFLHDHIYIRTSHILCVNVDFFFNFFFIHINILICILNYERINQRMNAKNEMKKKTTKRKNDEEKKWNIIRRARSVKKNYVR